MDPRVLCPARAGCYTALSNVAVRGGRFVQPLTRDAREETVSGAVRRR